jgi:hypothetical protein
VYGGEIEPATPCKVNVPVSTVYVRFPALMLDENDRTPPIRAAFVTTNELAVVVPESLAKVRAALPAAVPALL